MSNHPNRGPQGPARNPSPDEILGERFNARLTQTAAAALLHTTCRTWQQWEKGDRRMHPAFWELFLFKAQVEPEMAACYAPLNAPAGDPCPGGWTCSVHGCPYRPSSSRKIAIIRLEDEIGRQGKWSLEREQCLHQLKIGVPER